MSETDLNLLRALDALLETGSVTRAAARSGLSVSAMSRALSRLRTATGDPLFVRAGGRLVPTPHALALAERVPDLLARAEAVLAPAEAALAPSAIDRTFTLRAGEGYVRRFAAPLLAELHQAAPLARLRILAKPAKEAAPLRAAEADLEIGVLGDFAPEVRARVLFRDRFVAAVRHGHPLLPGPVTAARFAACLHVVASRRGAVSGPVDDALAELGLVRRVLAVVPGFPDALEIARTSDLLAQVPSSVLPPDMAEIALPVAVPGITVSALWHPRLDADPAQRWFRELVFGVTRAGMKPAASRAGA
ncbi:LysR family transcriptional regulator [Poseidonocella sp. HB161398]|uniref:LysR family transcriptional regulator n=1 Tax=Poseidonocella sp. HB161398 TaxID=2320855 RepID=UPI001107E20A|nr:LysR family transcriptional regulator [Poseidonocella sp. HB161398]